MNRSIPLLYALLSLGVVAGCARVPTSIRLDRELRDTAVKLNRLHAHAAEASLTYDLGTRLLRGRSWLAASPDVGLRLRELKAMAEDGGAFNASAHSLLSELAETGAQRGELHLAGLPEADARSVDRERARLFERELQHLESLETPRQRRAWVEELSAALPPSDPHGVRWARQLLGLPAAPFIYGWMGYHILTESRGPGNRDFSRAIVFEPDRSRDSEFLRKLSLASEDELLALYAPVVVQQIRTDAHYNTRNDRIGTAELVPDGEGRPRARIDSSRPAIYGWTSRARLRNRWYTQVNYSIWYPSHPEFEDGDPEAGRIEGLQMRLTLDGRNRPLVAESVFACGCYHRIYPTEALMQQAAEEGMIRDGEGSAALARRRFGKIDAYVPESTGPWSVRRPHPAIYVTAGKHHIAGVRFLQDSEPAGTERNTYYLLPEATLHRLPWGDGNASFFGRDGLVRGADRPEAFYLFPTGIYHAGTPRAAGLHFIHFDHYDYDDPSLLERLVYLPSIDSSSSSSLADAQSSSGDSVAVAALPDANRRLR